MLTDEERKTFDEYAQIFLNNFKNRDITPFAVCEYIRKATLNCPTDPSVSKFYSELAKIWGDIINNKDFTFLFQFTDHHKNYKEQKIAKYYREQIFPYEFMLYSIITNTNNGRACYLRSLIDTFEKTGVSFDSKTTLLLADYYDSLPVQFSKSFYNNPNEFYSLEREKREYFLSLIDQNRSARSLEFKLSLRDRLIEEAKQNGIEDPYNSVSYEKVSKAYQSYVIGNVGELQFVNQMFKSPFFIHSSKEVSNHVGYDVYDFADREYLYEVKTTLGHKKDDESDTFRISSYEYERMMESFKRRKYGTEEYIVARVFLTLDLEIDEILYLRLKDERTLEDTFGNTYTSDKKDKKGSLIFERKGFIRKQTSDKN